MRRLLLVFSAIPLAACLEEVRTCAPATVNAGSLVTCSMPDDAGLSRTITVSDARRKDAMPAPSADFGCHFESDGGELSLVGDGEVCARLGYDETDVVYLSRECVPPLGSWRLNVASRGRITVDVTDAGIRCGL